MKHLINYEGSEIDFIGKDSKTLLIDADSIIYIIGYQQKDSYDYEETMSKVNNFISDMLIINKCNQYAGFFSDKVTFRHEIYPEYKGKRPPIDPDIARWKPQIIQHCKDFWKFEQVVNTEADDVVVLLQNNMLNTTIASPDKDLKICEGNHYDYKKHLFEYVNSEQARYNRAFQMLIGDATDNIKGLKGVGAKGAEKLLKDVTNYEEFVKQTYLEKSTLEDYELHKILIGIGDRGDYKEYILSLQTFNLAEAEPSDFLKQFM